MNIYIFCTKRITSKLQIDYLFYETLCKHIGSTIWTFTVNHKYKKSNMATSGSLAMCYYTILHWLLLCSNSLHLWFFFSVKHFPGAMATNSIKIDFSKRAN